MDEKTKYQKEVFEKNIKKRTAKKNHQEYDSSQLLIIIQIFVCAAVILCVILLKSISPQIFGTAKEWYQEKLNDSLIIGNEEENFQDSGSQFVINNLKSDTKTARKNPEAVTCSKNIQKTPSLDVFSKIFTEGITSPAPCGVITSKFGQRIDPFTGNIGMHSGLDIAADENTEILAAMSGTVETADNNPSLGNYIVLEHGNNVKTLYAHCNKFLVEEGQDISQKQEIALMGSTGRSTGSHVHFEVIIDGIENDPEQFLR